MEEKIAYQHKKKENYQSIEKKLQESGEDQVSLTDPDAKSVILLRNIVNVGYNVQASADAKNKLVVEYDTGHVNDTHALSEMAISSKELLNVETLNAIADKGYHTGEEIQRCGEHNIITYVSPRESSTNNEELYPVENFVYNKNTDTYTCPAGYTLTTTGKWYRHSDSRKGRLQILKKYRRSSFIAHSDYIATTNMEICNDCGICVDRCIFEARYLRNNKLVIDKEQCYGCGLCVTKCPEKAISMELIDQKV